MTKTFLLGVGAQKSGTTWLYHYLSEQPMVNFGDRKEYHIWDGLYVNRCRDMLATPEDALIYKLQNEDVAYESYFSSLINDTISFTGDISPSYCGLSPKHFALIKKKLEDAGFNVKVIFLMRDPFERCWSAVRMSRCNLHSDNSEIEDLRTAYQLWSFTFRTNYKHTVKSLESVFEKKQIFYGIYEELFTVDNLKAITNFCCLPFNEGIEIKKYNVSPKLDYEAEMLREEIRKYFSDVYEFCYERFPQTKTLWAHTT